MTDPDYPLLVLQDDLSDQRALLKDVERYVPKHREEIEGRIESLKKAIKILKEEGK